jgi:transcription initiation factor TFIIIB Brf1 subunit/transcription initiation factor TFIIB
MEKILICKDCNSKNLHISHGSYVCVNCGLLKTDTIFPLEYEEPEEMIPTFIHKGSKTFVLRDNKYVYSDIYRLQISTNYSSAQKALDNTRNIINSIFGILKTPKYEFFAMKLWESVSKKTHKGSLRKGLIACCIYYSCIHNNYPIDNTEICRYLGIDTKCFNKTNKEFINLLDPKFFSTVTKNLEIEDYFNKYCFKFEDIDYDQRFLLYKKCIELYKLLDEKNCKSIKNYNKKIVASSIIYIVSINNNMSLKRTDIIKILPYSKDMVEELIKV